MSDQQIGKKMVEEEELRLFLAAYEYATEEVLKYVGSGESPDFVCTRPDGRRIGVELTRVTRSPDERFADWIYCRRDEQDVYEALEGISVLVEAKEGKRGKHYGEFASSTILVLQLFDCSLGSLLPFLDESMQSDFFENGFLEIWLANHTGVEAYGDIELFGLKPVRWWGYHERPNPGRKPYG